MRAPLAVAVLVATVASPTASPAQPALEGRFASADAGTTAEIRELEGGGVEVAVRGPALGEPVTATLQPQAGSGVLQRPEQRRSWFERLMGTSATALPFSGERLVFGRRDDGTLVVSTLEVDGGGRPTFTRLALAPTAAGLSLSVRRYGPDGLESGEPITLERTEP